MLLTDFFWKVKSDSFSQEELLSEIRELTDGNKTKLLLFVIEQLESFFMSNIQERRSDFIGRSDKALEYYVKKGKDIPEINEKDENGTIVSILDYETINATYEFSKCFELGELLEKLIHQGPSIIKIEPPYDIQLYKAIKWKFDKNHYVELKNVLTMGIPPNEKIPFYGTITDLVSPFKFLHEEKKIATSKKKLIAKWMSLCFVIEGYESLEESFINELNNSRVVPFDKMIFDFFHDESNKLIIKPPSRK